MPGLALSHFSPWRSQAPLPWLALLQALSAEKAQKSRHHTLYEHGVLFQPESSLAEQGQLISHSLYHYWAI